MIARPKHTRQTDRHRHRGRHRDHNQEKPRLTAGRGQSAGATHTPHTLPREAIMMASWTGGSHRMPLLPGARTAALLRPAPTILAATRQLSSGGGNGQRRTLRRDRLRGRGQPEKSGKALIEDMGSRNQEMSSLREVIREESSRCKPPQALYSQQGAFRFPAPAQSLAGDEVNLSTSSSGLFSNNKWTRLGAQAQTLRSRWSTAGSTAPRLC